MTNPEEMEEEQQRALSRALRGVSGTMVPRDPATLRPPTPMGILGPRAAEDKSKRRKKLDDDEEKILNG